MTKTIKDYKDELERELTKLELELTDIGKLNSDPSHFDWTGTAGNLETGTADKNILADKFEEETTNDAIVDELEVRLAQVKKALAKMDDGSYGICEECGEEISSERLDANPAATKCIKCAD